MYGLPFATFSYASYLPFGQTNALVVNIGQPLYIANTDNNEIYL